MRKALILNLAGSVLAAFTAFGASKADYHDVTEMESALLAFDGMAGGRITVHTIGSSALGRPIYAVQLAAVDGAGNQLGDDSSKPALLVEAGMHAREWAGPELTLLFLLKFLFATAVDADRVDDILAHANIWLIPMGNPDGRAMDDAYGGDPERYWTSTLWHDDDTAGWRPSAWPAYWCGSSFSLGIDLNRNFSDGWQDDVGGDSWDCRNNEFHGEAPFQAEEANVMRRFVNNRMISQSLSLHSYKGSIEKLIGSADIRDNFRDLWNAAVPSTIALCSSCGPGGSGVGQFTSWLAKPADTPFEPDMGTRRGIMTLLCELPPGTDDYDADYTYRWSSTDDSNGFHPSSDAFLTDAAQGLYAALMYLAEQARAPWCPINPTTLAPDTSCGPDFGLTGSKIAGSRDSVGALSYAFTDTGAEETMYPGARRVVYRVQNFDCGSTAVDQARVTVVISSRSDWPTPYSTDLVDTQYFDLGAGDAATGEVPFQFVGGRDYLVSIGVSPVTYSYSSDTISDNNHHQFRFRTHKLTLGAGTVLNFDPVTLPAGVKVLGRAGTEQTEAGQTNRALQLASPHRPGPGGLFTGPLASGHAVTNLSATFDVRMDAPTNGLASGFSFNLAEDLPPTACGVEGAGAGLTIVFDNHNDAPPSEPAEAPAIDVKWNGRRIGHQLLQFAGGGAFVPVRVDLKPDGRLDLRYGGVLVYSNLPTGYVPGPAQLSLSGGGAGASDTIWLDNLQITARTGAPAFIAQPQPAQVQAGSVAEFAAHVDGTPPFSFQWHRNGQPIPGASGPTYTTPPTALPMSGNAYFVIVSNQLGSAQSASAVLTVVADTIPPVALSAASLSGSSMGICFNERLTVASATNPAHYSVNGGNVPVVSAALQADGKSVVLQLNGNLGVTFTVQISGLQDLVGNTLGSAALAGAFWGTGSRVGAGATGTTFSCEPGEVAVAAAGAGLRGGADQFQFVFQRMTNDFDIRVQVASLAPASGWAQAGLVARASLETNGATVNAYAALSAASDAGVYEGTRRATNGGEIVAWGRHARFTPAGGWVRLKRTGDLFAAFFSADGQEWKRLAGPTSQTMPPVLQVGLATASGSSNELARVEFRNFGAHGVAPVITDVSPLTGIEGTVLTITGQGFGTNRDHIAVVIQSGGRTIPLEVLSSSTSQILAKLGPVPPDASSGSVMVAVGTGSRATDLSFPAGTTVAEPRWVWDFTGSQAQGPVFTPLANSPQPGVRRFFSQPPQNGELALVIDNQWPAEAVLRLSTHLDALSTGAGHAQLISGLKLSGSSGSVLDRARQLCDVLTDGWVQRAGLFLTCEATEFGPDQARIILRLPFGSLTAGHITMEADATLRGEDFGDAPAPSYLTLLPGGARHAISGLYLGASVDAETNGQPVDRDGADEAGVGIPPLVMGRTVNLSITASTNGLLDAWLDFDGTPGWGPTEQVFTNLPVMAGTHAYPLAMPAGAVPGDTWFRFRLSSAGGLAPGGLAPDGEVEDYRTRIQAPPNPDAIMVLLDLHADPMGGPVSTQAVTFSNWVNASHWLLDRTEPRGAKVSFLTVGGFAEWAREIPDLGYPLMQRLYASGAQLGTHSHTEYRASPHNWTNLPPAPSLPQLTNFWNDHLNMVDALVAESLGFTAAADIRRVNSIRGSHAPSSDQLRLDFLAMSGYTQHQQGPDEQYYAYFEHYPMNPYRPRGTNLLEHDPAGPVVLAPFGPVLGANAIHYGINQDMRQPAVKARMLLEVLNWLHDRRVAGTERIWVSGWGQHCSDVLASGPSYTNVVPMLDWLNEHFIGKPVGGAVAANWASMGEAGEAYRQWETTHPGAASFSYAPTNTDWNQYQYLRPAAAYLASAFYLSNMPPVGPVRWHAVTVNPDSPAAYTAYVAYTTNGVPINADLSSHLAAPLVASVNPVSGAASNVPATSVSIPSIGAILVPTDRVLRLRFDFGDAPAGYPVMLAQNGARHAPSALRLGTQADTEWDGRASANANGDDLATAPDDEDGVILPAGGLLAGHTNVVMVRMTGAASAALDVWFDWNDDSDWYDADEHFSLTVGEGTNVWNLPVPVTASFGQTAARFRLSTAGTPWPTDAATDGEVEDYRVQILPPPAEVVWVRNPTSGVDLYCHIHRPATLAPGAVYPGIVLVPGGQNDGGSFDAGNRAQNYADLGFIVMHFDPDGRGASTAGGTYTNENYCGYLHQDGLRAVLQHMKDLAETDDLNLGILSSSYGITMASGFLARYPGDPLVKFLMDWEGPANRMNTATNRGHVPRELSDEAFWSEREATEFISSFAGYYLRVQTEDDHVQPDNDHAIQLVNLATDTPYGGSGRCLWTRVNSAAGPAENSPNATYSPASPPNWIAEHTPPEPPLEDSLMQDYLLELAALPPLRLDYGNAPPPYPSTLASGSARHNFASGWRLGTLLDWEIVGPDAAPADEDGVVIVGPLVAGTNGILRVTASNVGRLDAFLDWNRDGDWNDPGERVTLTGGSPLVAGTNLVTVPVPTGVVPGGTWARFRFSGVGGLGPTGSAAQGEVEDYAAVLIRPIMLSASYTDGSLQISWDADSGGVLERAETVLGPWTEITNTIIPYVVGPTGAQRFFRVRMTIP